MITRRIRTPQPTSINGGLSIMDAHWYSSVWMGPSAEKAAISSREEILLKLRERIVGFAASRLQRDVAEDLAQEVLILLHEKYGHLERLEDLLPLSLQIVRFKMMALRRKAQRHGDYTQVPMEEIQLADGAADPLVMAERSEMRERLVAAVA